MKSRQLVNEIIWVLRQSGVPFPENIPNVRFCYGTSADVSRLMHYSCIVRRVFTLVRFRSYSR